MVVFMQMICMHMCLILLIVPLNLDIVPYPLGASTIKEAHPHHNIYNLYNVICMMYYVTIIMKTRWGRFLPDTLAQAARSARRQPLRGYEIRKRGSHQAVRAPHGWASVTNFDASKRCLMKTCLLLLCVCRGFFSLLVPS